MWSIVNAGQRFAQKLTDVKLKALNLSCLEQLEQ